VLWESTDSQMNGRIHGCTDGGGRGRGGRRQTLDVRLCGTELRIRRVDRTLNMLMQVEP